MESDFGNVCRQIATYFADLADSYEKDKQNVKTRLDIHDKEIVNNNETKKRIFQVLQEDLNGI